jgi:two-component system, OmpR family, sensor histidine kinase VicK
MENIKPEFSAVQQIGEISRDAVFIYSIAEERILYANAIAFDLLGLKTNSDRLDIESIFERVIPQDRAYLKSQYVTVTEKSLTGEVEFQLTDPNGRKIFVCGNAFLIADKSALVVFVRDITMPKKHEDYLVEYGARKNSVLDTLAHHISGALNLMQHLSTEATKYIETTNNKNLGIYLGLLNANSSHCLQIIYDLLKDEHSESPSVSVKNTRIDLVEKISVIYSELHQSYRERKFIFNPSSSSLYINTDEVKLLQVVNNLTSNAIKFSPPEKAITIRISETTTDVIVSVKDQGIGIPNNLKPFIFQTQFGVGRRGLNGEYSIGLGLSISSNLIKLMSGKIWFETEPDAGSTFYFSLPKDLV